ncbi:hypothetical protein BIV57_07605 [Mangrovactinospora gilvigrisea]|uniref:SnoaL-like domain-containing protein n=1 Tax=Mangrovactinospora gilvigrisea TaxID=1428644 RepID=A0A1J7CEK3_9ACTN|nr:nuclear transport factor 2 family protein [Mangrovactinospora gilvigrisea]OIV38114.1 hypothetical protein BIV57_07605 [Mangrovactinospora gilvigrisea]
MTVHDDRAALTELLARWDRWLDDSRFTTAETAEIFAPDAEVSTPGGVLRGLEEITREAARTHGRWTATQHLHTGTLIEVDGDRADLDISRLMVMVGEGRAPANALGERARLRAVRTPDGWRLSRVAGEVLWAADPAGLARVAAAAAAARAAETATVSDAESDAESDADADADAESKSESETAAASKTASNA